MINNKQKALIHVAKSQVGMSEEEYRSMLEGVGVSSSTELSYRGFDQVMQRFEALGFVSRRKSKGQRRTRLRSASSAAASKEALIGKIAAILADLKLSWSYADGVAKRMFRIEFVQWCDAEQLHKVVAALMYHQKRVNSNQ